MNMAFDGIVLSRVTELLNETIVTGRISKLYQISKYELLMTVRLLRVLNRLDLIVY